MPDERDSESLLPYAGLGGIAVCCLGIELLGGAAIVSGLAATVGLSTGATYLGVVGVGGLTMALLALGYHQFGGASNV
jgi:hypothetical protein